MDEQDWPDELDERVAAVASADDPYRAAMKVMGCAGKYLTTSIVASRLYQIWAALTDWFDLKPEERAQALAEMRRASGEWVSVKDDQAGRETYLDDWQYDVLGYARRPPAGT
jgi:hypothetical protein